VNVDDASPPGDAHRRRLKSPVAFVLGLVLPGLGHLYAGRRGTAIVVYEMLVVLAALRVFIGLGHFPLLAGIVGLLVGFTLITAVDALGLARRARTAPRAWWSSWPVLIGAVVVHYVLVQGALGLVGPYGVERMPTSGMEPTVHAGDRFVLRRGLPPLARGDIVMFAHPVTGAETLKRIIGLPGETISLVDGAVRINDVPLQEPYADPLPLTVPPRLGRMAPITVPPGHLFVLGDHRGNSEDSRFFGPIPLRSIRGKAKYIIFSRHGGLGRRLDLVSRIPRPEPTV
jgi:signal peptidase I